MLRQEMAGLRGAADGLLLGGGAVTGAVSSVGLAPLLALSLTLCLSHHEANDFPLSAPFACHSALERLAKDSNVSQK